MMWIPIYAALSAAFSEHHVDNPEFMGIHFMDASSVEECWRILRQSGKSIGYESIFFWYVTIMCGIALVAAITMPDTRRQGLLTEEESKLMEV